MAEWTSEGAEVEGKENGAKCMNIERERMSKANTHCWTESVEGKGRQSEHFV